MGVRRVNRKDGATLELSVKGVQPTRAVCQQSTTSSTTRFPSIFVRAQLFPQPAAGGGVSDARMVTPTGAWSDPSTSGRAHAATTRPAAAADAST